MSKIKKLFLVFMAFSSLVSTSSWADRPSTHGMLLFGKASTYASHLPMFHAPHDYQVLLKLKLSNSSNAQTLESYEKAKTAGETFFTLVPELMDLTQIIDGNKTSFSAVIFSGHFERGGKSLGTITVEIEKVMYSAKLKGNQPPQTANRYLVFGEKGEYYASHLIQERPSFDLIASVGQPYTLSAAPCRTRTCEDRKKLVADALLPITLVHEKETTDLELPLESATLGISMGSAQTEIQKILYSEIDELSH